MTGKRWAWQAARRRATSQVEAGKATASGGLRVVVGGVPGAGLAVGGGGAQAVPEDLPQVGEESAGRGGAGLHGSSQIRQRNSGREKPTGISPAWAERVPGRM